MDMDYVNQMRKNRDPRPVGTGVPVSLCAAITRPRPAGGICAEVILALRTASIPGAGP